MATLLTVESGTGAEQAWHYQRLRRSRRPTSAEPTSHDHPPYSWNASGEEAAGGLKTVVTWTLTPVKGGVLVRMEQSGFRPEDEANYQGATYGWQRFIGGLERVAAGLD